jgi:hypothetical protein
MTAGEQREAATDGTQKGDVISDGRTLCVIYRALASCYVLHIRKSYRLTVQYCRK